VPFTTARYFLRQPVAVQVRVKRHMQLGLCFLTHFEFNSKKGMDLHREMLLVNIS
jgi:hypothetical protein